jgi:hypothetical protein
MSNTHDEPVDRNGPLSLVRVSDPENAPATLSFSPRASDNRPDTTARLYFSCICRREGTVAVDMTISVLHRDVGLPSGDGRRPGLVRRWDGATPCQAPRGIPS